MNVIEQFYNFLLSMFMCAVFALGFLTVAFLGQGFVCALRWLYHRYQWVRWFNRQY